MTEGSEFVNEGGGETVPSLLRKVMFPERELNWIFFPKTQGLRICDSHCDRNRWHVILP